MIAIVNSMIPDDALKTLKKYATPILFSTSGITYNAISNHPDIFFCQDNETIIAAPNTPEKIKKILIKNNVNVVFGTTNVGTKYPETSHYNAVITQNYLIHNSKFTDNEILIRAREKEIICVNQAYTRCNLLPFDETFITSDKGIEMQLNKNKITNLFVDPSEIILSGFANGFFGGACGIHNNHVFLCGSLKFLKSGLAIKQYMNKLNIELTELYDGPLIDIGSILICN